MGFEILPRKGGKVAILRTVTMTTTRPMFPSKVPDVVFEARPEQRTWNMEIFWTRLANKTVEKGDVLTQEEVEVVRGKIWGMKA